MPLFGGGEKRQADNDALGAEVERVSALPLQELAVETMTKGFGLGGPGESGPTSPGNLAGAFIPSKSSHGLDQDLLNTLGEVVNTVERVLSGAKL